MIDNALVGGASSIVLLDVFAFCDVATLKSLRLVHPSFRDLIDTYQTSLVAKLKSRLFTTKDLSFVKSPIPDPTSLRSTPLQRLFLLEFRTRTAKWLSEVGPEHHQEDARHEVPFGNVGAREEAGNALRACHSTGWGVFWNLSDIAREIIDDSIRDRSPGRITDRNIVRATRGIPSLESLEADIRHQQLLFVGSLTDAELEGYWIVHGTIGGIFRNCVFDNPYGSRAGERCAGNMGTGNDYATRESWLNWFILREGPGFIARALGTEQDNDTCLSYLTTEWFQRSQKQILVEQTASTEVEALLSSRLSFHSRGALVDDLLSWAEPGRAIDRIYRNVPFRLGRRISRDSIRALERERTE